jgi:hypothetical protein
MTPFFWWTMHVLLAGRVAWRTLLPSAVITGVLYGRSRRLFEVLLLRHDHYRQQDLRDDRRDLRPHDLVYPYRGGDHPRSGSRCRLGRPQELTDRAAIPQLACPQGTPRHPCLPIRKQDAVGRPVSSSLRYGTRGRGIAWFVRGDDGPVTAPVVNDHRAGGGQGGAGPAVVVAAQQQVNRMSAGRGGRDEDQHYRPGGAAAGAITQIVRPGPGSRVIGERSGSLTARGPPGGLGPAARKPHPHPYPAGIRCLAGVLPGPDDSIPVLAGGGNPRCLWYAARAVCSVRGPRSD